MVPLRVKFPLLWIEMFKVLNVYVKEREIDREREREKERKRMFLFLLPASGFSHNRTWNQWIIV